MRLSVVIPALNEAAGIAACVRSALALRLGWKGVIEVIVADGGSVDTTAAAAETAGARVVSSPRGRGNQLRAGVEASTGHVVLMLHADTTLDREAGGQMAEALADPRVGCGAFRQKIDSRRRIYRWLEAGNAFRARRMGLPYGDQAIFVRRELLDSVGGVPDLPLMEDVALMRALRRRAWPVLLDGPLRVSARRWQRRGVVGQTLRNWALLTAYTGGVSAERLASYYRPHVDCPTTKTPPTPARTPQAPEKPVQREADLAAH